MTKNIKAFANPAPVAKAAKSPEKKAALVAQLRKERVAPEITTVSVAVKAPERKTRGNKVAYPFDALPIGGSFGIKNKTAKQIASVVSGANKKALVPKRDANGVVFKVNEVKGVDGEVTRTLSNEPVMVRTKKFFALDVDAKTDPDGATVRVWREEVAA